MSDEVALVVDDAGHGATIAAIVRGAMNVPWSRARQLCRDGRVTLDGTLARDDAARVRRGQRVIVRPTAPRVREVAGELSRDRIVHLDGELVVVDKPAGLQSVPFTDEDHDSLAQRTTMLLRRLEGKRLPPVRVVQRLDKDTSGLVVFARTKSAERALAQQLRTHAMHRRYHALAYGAVQPGTMRSLLLDDRGDGLRGSFRGPDHRAPSGAREAVTIVELERHVEIDGVLCSWITCRLQTGRTHQIRIHLSESGHPLVGEHVYIRGFDEPPLRWPAGFEPRTLLHAAELGFVHPASGEEIRFERPEPPDFAAWRAASATRSAPRSTR
ncbi:MAG TPA: RluA family pseudouridine synthase [Nannocystaceae bacterium]|nr:RluA family pseudouridine synthase [Nannocystaceae bacterium]